MMNLFAVTGREMPRLWHLEHYLLHLTLCEKAHWKIP